MLGVPAPTAAGDRPAAAPPPSGPIRFARYAFGPNRLGYCGPEASQELFEQATGGGSDGALRHLARDFEGAWPYLELIAEANGIPDPLDARVVDAYWIGNDFLRAVSPAALGRNLEVRFRPRLRADGWRWMAATPEAGAVPVHAFHVLDVFPKVGLLRTGELDGVLQIMDSCRIRWGRVLERDGDWLVVSAVPLELGAGKLRIGPARAERIRAWWDGASFLDAAVAGDIISIHWDWACERLDPDRLARLIRFTTREIEIANRSL
ncbi:MAG: hypothetical protein HY264_09125 [Chloroflexi bacterium]|nr:hypothetical protein [Chloroflexota bacterium]